MRASHFSLIALFFVGWLGAAALPISFEERDRTFFVARSGNGSAHIHPDRVVMGGVTLHFLHAARESRLEGVGPTAPSNYLDGTFRRSFDQFPQLAIRGLYAGIDAIFHGDGEHLEYDLQLAPGASPGRVRLSFEGARHLRLDQDGNLIVETASGVLRQLVPRVFQTRNGRPQEVSAQYILLPQGQVGFRLGKHDSHAALTIDPVLVYVKYFGGTGSDSASQVATDAQGNAYVAGLSNSTDFPVTNGSAIKPTPPLIALSNGGQTVTPLPVASELSVTAIGGTPDGNILYAATTDGIFVSTNAGATWRQTAPLPFLGDNSFSALTVNDIAVDVFDPARAYVATSRGLFATMDAGQSWGAHDFGLAATSSGLVFVQSVIVSAVDHTVLYATTSSPNYLYKSVDAGGSWQFLKPLYPGEGEPALGFTPGSQIVAALVPGGSDLYVVNANANLLKSTDGGATWQRLGGRLFGARAITLDRNNASNIYVTDNLGVQKSTDGGLTFVTITPPGVQGLDVKAFAIDPTAATLYLASSSSIYVSADQGVTWTLLRLISSSSVHKLLALGGRVYAGLDTPRTPFVVKLDPSGSRLLYSTFFGGSPSDFISALKVDAQGNAFLAGFTTSQKFPFTSELSNPSPVGQVRGFVVKLSADGGSLIYAAHLGGSQTVFIKGLAIDSSGSAYVTGQTSAPDFPVTPNAVQPKLPSTPCTRPPDVLTFRSPNLGGHAFVSKLNPDGGSLAYSTLLSGSCGSDGEGIVVNAAGEAIVTGATTSPDFPVSPNAYQPVFPGPFNQGNPTLIFNAGFVARLSAAGDKVLASTFLGGGFLTTANAATLDASGNVIVTGLTWGFATGASPGAFQSKVSRSCAPVLGIGPPAPPSGGGDAFLLKLDPALTMAAYLTYLGGGCDDSGSTIALAPDGSTWVAGFTSSADFPLNAPFQAGTNGGFVSELSGDGSTLLFSSFSDGSAMALDSKGSVYLAGASPFSTVTKRMLPAGALATSAFLARLDPGANPPVIINSIERVTADPSPLVAPGTVLEPPAPGQLIRITGRNLGPAKQLDAQLDASGRLPFSLATTRVLFDNFPAPLLSVQDTTILCFAPFEISQITQVAAEFNGQRSNTVRLGVPASAPQILAVANQDGTLNSADHPAHPGDVIVLYASGLGVTNPPSVDGMINSTPLPVPMVRVTVSIGGRNLQPQFVGAAVGLVAGITQVNVQVPVIAYSSNRVSIGLNFGQGILYIVP